MSAMNLLVGAIELGGLLGSVAGEMHSVHGDWAAPAFHATLIFSCGDARQSLGAHRDREPASTTWAR